MINVVDLFSGAGGLTLGFYKKAKYNHLVKRDSFHFLFANEINHFAAAAFRYNFPDIPLLECDIADITPELLALKKINFANTDIVIGGPPCQSYSTVGKRQYDQRARMYQEYIRLLGFIKPKMFIFENVTGLLTMENNEQKPVIEDIKEMFRDIKHDHSLGYLIHQTVLNAKDYGVPQNRERVFIVGTRQDTSLEWDFPKKTYGEGLLPYLTVSDAISDFPSLENNETKTQYSSLPANDYQKLLREGSSELNDHVCGNYGRKMTRIMESLSQGESKGNINEKVASGLLDKDLFLTSGYKNTYGRLWWDRPSTTITNSLGTPSALRCIHPFDNRALTTREGARLQSFPDVFHFYGNKYEKNSQIGNAVPPILAMALADSVIKSFE